MSLNDYKSPGIYIEEISPGPGPIESAATAVLAIVGFVRESDKDKDKPTPAVPTLVTNWTEFTAKFGDFDQAVANGYLHPAVYGYFLNGGRQVYIVPLRLPKDDWSEVTDQTFIGNDTTGINALEAKEEVTMVACPDVLAAYIMMKPKPTPGANSAAATAAASATGPAAATAAASATGSAATPSDFLAKVQNAMTNHCAVMKNRIAILDVPAGLSPDKVDNAWLDKQEYRAYAALYYPWIQVADWKLSQTTNPSDPKPIPPSGHIAGVYARVDSERGVHKAPANEVVRGAIGLEFAVTRDQQDKLNPVGVNCIRTFPGQGIRIWGARTLAPDIPWRYINVRRLFCNIEDSIIQSTRWIVFEPNNRVLWAAIRRDISAYLTVRWREGALFGNTPEQAFYVKCDEETNPKELRDKGYCVIEVGIAPVKPAEFVVFRIGQWQGGSSATEVV